MLFYFLLTFTEFYPVEQPLIHNEKQLLLRVAEGDEAAFTLLFNVYRPRIYTVGLKITGSENHTEELVQDIFLKVWLRREMLNEVENFSAYLFTMVKNAAYNALKSALKRKEKEEAASDDMPGTEIGLEHLLEAKDYNNVLHQAVTRLPLQQSKVYRMVKVQGYKREEVAAALGISPLTVKKHLQEARRSVRAYMVARLDLHNILIACWLVAEELM